VGTETLTKGTRFYYPFCT